MIKKLLKKILKEFIYGGHLLSLGAASIVWATLILVNHNIGTSWPVLFLAYLSSQIVYNHDHLDEINDEFANAERTKHLKDTRNYQIASLATYAILFAISCFFTTITSALIAILIVAGGVFYTKKAKTYTKSIFGFKNYYIAFFWSILPILTYFHLSDKNLLSLTVAFSLFVYARWILNTVFFDLKDAKEDSKKGLKTVPAVYGFAKTISYLHIVNLISVLIIVAGVLFEFIPLFGLAFIFFPVYSYIYLVKASGMSGKVLRIISYVVVDGEYLLWPLALLIVRPLLP